MLKATTRQLIESFRYRHSYLGKEYPLARYAAANALQQERRNHGRRGARRQQIRFLPYRKHLATLHSTNGG